MKLPHETSLILYDVLLGSDVLMILLCIHTLICSWRISKGWNKKKLFFFLMILVFTSRATQNIMDTIVLAGGSYNPETQVPSLIMAVISENCFFAAQCLIMTIWTHHLQAVAFVPSKHKRAGLTFQKRIVSVCFGSMVFLVFVESVVVAKLTFNFDNEDYADSDLLHYSQVARSALWGFMALLSLIIGIWLFQQVFLSKSTQAKGVYRKLARTDSANTTETLRFLEKKVIMQRRSRDLLVLSVIFWLSLTLRACAFVFQRSLYDYIAAVNFSLAFTVEIIPTIVASQILVHRAHQTSSTTKNELLTRLLPPRSSVAQTIPSPTRLSKLNPIRTSFSLSPPRSSIASVNTMTSL